MGAATDFTTSRYNIFRQLLWGQHLSRDREQQVLSASRKATCAQTPSPAPNITWSSTHPKLTDPNAAESQTWAAPGTFLSSDTGSPVTAQRHSPVAMEQRLWNTWPNLGEPMEHTHLHAVPMNGDHSRSACRVCVLCHLLPHLEKEAVLLIGLWEGGSELGMLQKPVQLGSATHVGRAAAALCPLGLICRAHIHAGPCQCS